MTCIVALQNTQAIWMGSDSQASGNSLKVQLSTSKVVRKPNMLIGAAGESQILPLLRYGFEVPFQKEGETDEKFMLFDFTNKLKEFIQENGQVHPFSSEDPTPSFPAQLLIAYKSSLYQMNSCFGCWKVNRYFSAIGSGDQFALGFMEGIRSFPEKPEPEMQVRLALQAAARTIDGVGEPLFIEKLEY